MVSGRRSHPLSPREDAEGRWAAFTAALLRGVTLSLLVALVGSSLMAFLIAWTGWLTLHSGVLLLINYLSVATGALTGARQCQHWGWFLGGSIGLFYGLIAFSLSTAAGGNLNVLSVLQGGVLLFLVGALAGMIGVNL
ncbi:MAG: TIGR04086 family membrane protein [Bacillota bacterium]|nr:TIGR04086 family membrane protein [Bacillota bacterium]